ncbi:MAG: DedA family protein [Patescibacteria group bacterium]|nr:DedA family protein [Patescibacteria group bacterium]
MFDLSSAELLNSISLWGYPLMLLFMILEGPIATMIAAYLASMGMFNVFIVFFLSMTGDVIGDVILYLIGFAGGRPTLLKAEKFLKIKHLIVEKIRCRFQKSGPRIIFYVKTTTGLCWITFLLAGAVKMNFKKFLFYSVLGGIVWSSSITATGFFFGFAAEQINQYIRFAGWIIFTGAIAAIIGMTVLKNINRKKFIEYNSDDSAK